MKLISILCALNVLATSAETFKVSPSDSIQKALEDVQPGDTLFLEDGTYNQDFTSVRSGTIDKRITITGSKKAIVKGEKNSRMIQIFHSYITLDGFTVDGQSGDGSKEEDFTDKLIYVHGQEKPKTLKRNGKEFLSSIDGMKITNMKIENAGGECCRMRYFITFFEFSGNHVENCGVHDFVFGGMAAVNGETLYVGTSSNQWGDGKNPTSGPDQSKYGHIHHNVLKSEGNELDVKEGSEYVVVEYNECSTQLDPNSACLDSRTDNIVFRYNNVFSNDGAGVRIGGHTISGKTYGQNNEVYGNNFHDNKAGALKLQTGPSKTCDNKCEGTCKVSGSASSKNEDITGKCEGLMDIDWIDSTSVDKPVVDVSTVETEEEEESGVAIVTIKNDLGISNDSSKCNALMITDVKTSTNGKNIVRLAQDKKSLTRWSEKGSGEWVELTLEETSEVDSIEVSFYKGDERKQKFDVMLDGESVSGEVESAGKTLNLEKFDFEKSLTGNVLRITGLGNNKNSWNSFTEVIVCGRQEGANGPHDVKTDSYGGTCDKVTKLDIDSVKSSSDDGNKASNVLDGNLKTRWSASGPDTQTLEVVLKESSFVSEVEISVHNGDARKAFFDIIVLTPNGWEDVLIDGESKKGSGLQPFDIGVSDVQIVKILGYGYDNLKDGKHSVWNSLTGVEVYGC